MAEDKPRRLRLLKVVGVRHPINTDLELVRVRQFAAGRTVVGRPLRQAPSRIVLYRAIDLYHASA